MPTNVRKTDVELLDAHRAQPAGKTPTTATDGGWLRSWRQRNGYTQETLAAELGVKRQTIITWEKSAALERLVVLAATALEAIPATQVIGARPRLVKAERAPADRPPAARAQQDTQGRQDMSETLRDPSRPRILAVDDNEISRRLASLLLEYAGAAAETAAGGLEAVAAARRAGFDLILMDIDMPEVDGFEAMGLIRGLPHPACGVPIIAVAAEVTPRELARYRAAGFDGALAKPLLPTAVCAEVARLLGECKGAELRRGAA